MLVFVTWLLGLAAIAVVAVFALHVVGLLDPCGLVGAGLGMLCVLGASRAARAA